MEQNYFIIILVIFVLSSNYSFIIKDIIKSIIYLILILSVVKMFNSNIEKKIKLNIFNFINSDNNYFTDLFSIIASYIKKFILSSVNNNFIVDITKKINDNFINLSS
jgi:hypothetical protein